MHVMVKWAEWFLLLPIELLVIFTVFFLNFVSMLVGHIEILGLIFVLRDGSLSSNALKSEQFTGHLETDSSLEGIRQHIFLH
jgi:hypothetical protein